MCFEGTGTLSGSDLMREINLDPAPPYIRPGAPEGECSGEREGAEGTGMIALYTHLRVPLDCYPLVTPLDTPNRPLLCSNVGENVRLCAKALQRGRIITFRN